MLVSSHFFLSLSLSLSFYRPSLQSLHHHPIACGCSSASPLPISWTHSCLPFSLKPAARCLLPRSRAAIAAVTTPSWPGHSDKHLVEPSSVLASLRCPVAQSLLRFSCRSSAAREHRRLRQCVPPELLSPSTATTKPSPLHLSVMCEVFPSQHGHGQACCETPLDQPRPLSDV